MKNLINIIEKLKVNSKSNISNAWTIEDAEDGDIIMSKYNQFIYKCLDKDKKILSRTNCYYISCLL